VCAGNDDDPFHGPNEPAAATLISNAAAQLHALFRETDPTLTRIHSQRRSHATMSQRPQTVIIPSDNPRRIASHVHYCVYSIDKRTRVRNTKAKKKKK